jgi:hypothetical protein
MNLLSIDVDENPPDGTTAAKLKTYLNRAYKEVAKRELLEKPIDVTAVDGKITKPYDFYYLKKVLFNNEAISSEEVAGYISVSDDGDMTLIYAYIPVDLTDNDTPLTNPGNDEAIFSFAKYLYFRSEGMPADAETSLRDFETYKIHRPKKNLSFSVVR